MAHWAPTDLTTVDQEICPIRKMIIGKIIINHLWLVVSIPLKNMSSSVGMIIPNIWKVIKLMFQTTNQIYLNHLDHSVE